MGFSGELGWPSSRMQTCHWVSSWHVAQTLVGIKWAGSAAELLEGQRHPHTLAARRSQRLLTLQLPCSHGLTLS